MTPVEVEYHLLRCTFVPSADLNWLKRNTIYYGKRHRNPWSGTEQLFCGLRRYQRSTACSDDAATFPKNVQSRSCIYLSTAPCENIQLQLFFRNNMVDGLCKLAGPRPRHVRLAAPRCEACVNTVNFAPVKSNPKVEKFILKLRLALSMT